MIRTRHIFCLIALGGSAWAQGPAPGTSMPVLPVAPAASLPEVQVPSVAAPPPAAAPDAATVLPAAEAPATTLPAVPATPAPAAAAPAPVVDTDAPFSYGNNPYSVMFSPTQLESMKAALGTYETLRRNGGPAPDIQVVETGAPAQAIAEPNPYPVYTLRSIAYRDAGDWTVWIGDLRITPSKNTQEVRVLGVNANSAQFAWKPAYSAVLRQRIEGKLLADTAPVKHKITKPNTAIFDQDTNQAVFSLRPNQSFVPAYMATFEGRVASPTLPPIPKPADATVAPPAQGAPTGENALNGSGLGGTLIQQMYKKAGGEQNIPPQTTMDSLLKNQQQLQSLSPPGHSGSAAPSAPPSQ